MSGCKTCGGPVGKRTKSGECRACANQRMNTDPEVIARRRAGMLRRNRSDPARKEQLRQMMAEARAARKPRSAEHMRRIGELGRAAMTPDVLARRGVSVSNARLAWCPPHLRDEYIFLSVNKRVPAAEARVMIEEQNEIEMARWRRSIGIVDENEIHGAVVVSIRARALTPFERAMAAAGSIFDVTEAQILSPERSRHISIARYALAVVLQNAGYSTPKIAAALNRSDHTSAIHWLKRADWYSQHNAKFAKQMAHVLAAWSDDQLEAA